MRDDLERLAIDVAPAEDIYELWDSIETMTDADLRKYIKKHQ